MQEDSSATFQPLKRAQFADQEQIIKCPRCESTNTKFCYYNNYNLSQPRHFCKNCRRYWTKGGSLRNIPVGGGSRKNSKRPASDSSSNNNNLNSAKRSSSSSSQSVSALAPYNNSVMEPEQAHVYSSSSIMGIMPESFTSLLGSNGHFGPILEEVEEERLSLNSNGSGLKKVQVGEFAENWRLDCGQVPEMELLRRTSNDNNSESYLDLQNGWNNQNGGHGSGGNAWPDLSIYTPGSSFL